MSYSKLSINQNRDGLRSLAQIFTPSHFNRVVRHNDYALTEKKLKKYYLSDFSYLNYKQVIESLYAKLQNEYRNEYFFKNNLLCYYLLNHYSLSTTTVFTEFRIGKSIADFILLNGKARIFEIKTDLDGLDKLEKQVHDYRQFADLVYIVTSTKFIDKIVSDYKYSTIGIIEFTKSNSLKEIKKAESNADFINPLTVFKTLWKSEYLEIINEYYGFIPKVPNTQIFKACFELVKNIEPSIFQQLAVKKLKRRKIKCPNLFESNKTPLELKQICYTLDFSEVDYNSLYSFLEKTI